MKRSYSREEEGADHDSEMMDRLDTANCLMLLGRRSHDPASRSPGRVFECKTCNRQFQSFQALGGHRASHKRAKLVDDQNLDRAANNPHTRPKVHECAICGTEFAMGQALGGHMRRHRAEAESFSVAKKSNGTTKRLYLDLNLPPSKMDGDFLGIGLVGKFPMVH